MTAASGRQRRLASIPLRRGLVLLIGCVCVLLAAVLVGISAAVLNSTLMQQLNGELNGAFSRLQGPVSAGIVPDNAPQGLHAPGLPVGTIVVRSNESVERAGYFSDTGAFHALRADQSAVLDAVPISASRPDTTYPSGSSRGETERSLREGTTVNIPELGTYVALAGTSSDGGRVIVAMSMARVNNTVHGFVLLTSGSALALIVLATIVGILVVRRSLQPLEDLTEMASEVTSLPLEEGPVELHTLVDASRSPLGTEVGDLEASFSRMLEHIEHAFAAREASESKVRRFAVDASHELRTPLASIKGYAELIRRYDLGGAPDATASTTVAHAGGSLTPEVRQALGRIESEATRMGRLVEDLLMLARYDAATGIEKRPVDLTALAFDVVADARAADTPTDAADSVHTWRVELGEGTDDAPIEIMAEPDRIRQVMVNLLANARIHTPAGTDIALRLHAEAGHAVVEVWDDGPEIPPVFVSRMFDRFSRADDARAAGAHGPSTGLGLSIVEAIVRAHGGTVTVRSAPGDVAFVVTLPAS